ncbi:MAG TPA: hypothetical protein VE544_08515, partial [Nitrososphaeraceae archaeon]|nr:hypothetical protein [Nitrososphaeraceae archaeon]
WKTCDSQNDGSPHVVPIWFLVENGKDRGKAGNIILTTNGNATIPNPYINGHVGPVDRPF